MANRRQGRLLIVFLIMACFSAKAAGQSVTLSQLDARPRSSESMFDDVPRGHWAYSAVAHLASLGLLDGWSEGKFRGDQVLTRYELAVIVDRMLDAFMERRGQVPPAISAGAPSALPESMLNYPVASLPPPAQNELPSMLPVGEVLMIPKETMDSSRARTMLPPKTLGSGARSGGAGSLSHSTPRELAGAAPADTKDKSKDAGTKDDSKDKDKAKAASAKDAKDKDKAASTKDKTASAKDKAADSKSKDAKDAKAKEEPAHTLKTPKELKDIEKKYPPLSDKDIAMFNALLGYVKDALKEMGKENKKAISEVKRKGAQNERDIESLKQENARWRVTGSGGFSMSTSRDIESGQKPGVNGVVGGASGVGNGAWGGMEVNGRPRKFDDLTFTSNIYGGDMRIRYQNYTAEQKGQRNILLRSLYVGRVGFGGLAPLAGNFGDIYGWNAQIRLGDYTITNTIGRWDGITYGAASNVAFNLFGNPNSTAAVTHLQTWEDADQKCKSNFESKDHFYYGVWGGSITDDKKYFKNDGDSACKPPEKNSVTSFFTIYPLKWIKGSQVYFEYAHSTYYRRGFPLFYQGSQLSAEAVPINENKAEFPNLDPGAKYSKYTPIPKMEYQDDAFLVLFNYTKSPISIFPMGYARLGNKFVSKHFGFPGLDVGGLLGGGAGGVLPITIQSLELLLAMGTLDKTPQKYKMDFMIATGGEIKPMYLDQSALSGDSKQLISLKLIDSLNKRGPKDTIKLIYWKDKITYFVSDRIRTSMEYSRIKAALGPFCADTSPVVINDDKGNIIDRSWGNGVTDCVKEDDFSAKLRLSTKSFNTNLYWRTSNKAEYSLDWSSSETKIDLSVKSAAMNDAIVKLIPSDRKYSLNQSINYKLTEVSSVNLYYNTSYRHPLTELVKNEAKNSNALGFSLSMSF